MDTLTDLLTTYGSTYALTLAAQAGALAARSALLHLWRSRRPTRRPQTDAR